jgi:hypothetical protein
MNRAICASNNQLNKSTMKKLIILSFLIVLITSCQERTTVDGISRAVYSTLKNNDFAGFQALYLTSQEMEMLISNGYLNTSESNQQTAINYFKSDELRSDQTDMFERLRDSDEIAWSQTSYESSEVDMKKEEGSDLDVYKIRIQILYTGKVKTIRHFKAIKLPANSTASTNEKFVLVN